MQDTITRPPQTGGSGDGEPDFDEMLRRMQTDPEKSGSDAQRVVQDAERSAIIGAGLSDLAPTEAAEGAPGTDWDAMEARMQADPHKVGSEAGRVATEQGLAEAGLNQPPEDNER